ncbi:MAG: hypothetical protein FRX49_00683 [Trebouxia sp. A1-2]|nr:MAG: hypothetical protein FRX49_00683 [Trebouxia sp. A1-2]
MDLVGFAGGVTTSILRFIGTVFSPAARLADRLEGTLIQAHLYEPQLKASQLEFSLWPQALLGDSRDYVKWLNMGWVAIPLGCAALIWSGICFFSAFACCFVLPVAGALSLPPIATMVAGCTTLRIMLAVKELLVYLMTTLRTMARLWLISWADENLPQHANQIRFLLNEMPRGQSLPTIVEEDEEGIGDDCSDDCHEGNTPAHAANYGTTTSNSKLVANNEFVQFTCVEGLTPVTTAA